MFHVAERVGHYHVEPYREWHYLEATKGLYAWQDAHKTARLYGDRGPAWTLFLGDQILATAGVVVIHPGLGEAWAVLTDAGRAHPLRVVRAIARRLTAIIEAERLRRCQAHVVQAHAPAVRLLLLLGFAVETPLRAYGPNGEDFLMMVRYPPAPEVPRG